MLISELFFHFLVISYLVIFYIYLKRFEGNYYWTTYDLHFVYIYRQMSTNKLQYQQT